MPISTHILEEASADRALDLLLFDAAGAHASDLVLEPAARDASVRIRLDGLSHELFRQSKDRHERLVARLKRLSRLRDEAPLVAQTGKLRRVVDDASIEGRLSVVPTLEGEKILVRLRTPRPGLSALGLADAQMARVTRFLKRTTGLLLVVGPRDSGVTTALHAFLKALGSPRRDIETVEDPIEADMHGARQEQVEPASGGSFAALSLAAIARKPDVLMIGALRDESTVSIAVSSARDRLVLAGLSASDASDAFARLDDFGVDRRRIVGGTILVLAGRLVRRVCPECRRIDTMSMKQALAAGWPRSLTQALFGDASSVTLVSGAKCASCRFTGYQGRIGLFELRETREPERTGPASFLEDGVAKVLSGITTVDELLRL